MDHYFDITKMNQEREREREKEERSQNLKWTIVSSDSL